MNDWQQFAAADGTAIHYRRWLPPGSPKAVLQIVHGAAEHASRYDRFAHAAVASGHAVYATDHRGHGRTRLRSGRLGDAGPDAWNRMVDDEIALSQRLRAAHPDMGLLFLSHYAESHYLMRILEIGTDAIGYRLKEKVGSVDVLTDTLTRIADGEIVIEPMLAKRLVERPRAERKDLVAALSERETDVLRLMAEGRSNGGIAGQLFVTPKAVEKHIANIFGKLGLHADVSEDHRRVLAVLTYLRSQHDGE